jgi:hypothetical protein
MDAIYTTPPLNGQLGQPGFLEEAVRRIGASLPPKASVRLTGEGDDEAQPVRQQTLSRAVAAAQAHALSKKGSHLDQVCMKAYSAPGTGRWLYAKPSEEEDKTLSNQQLAITARLQLGVDLHQGPASCRMCGSCRDVRGIHDLSCTVGGDILTRHNSVRDDIYGFARRARVNPKLEKAGLLSEPGVFLELRRPADVLIEGALRGARDCGPVERVALDVKVINALGHDHYDLTREHPLAAAEEYRRKACALNNTASLCAVQGIAYEPLVFTAQGGIEKHAEAILSQLAELVADVESREVGDVKAEFLERISFTLARHTANAVLRRQGRAAPHATNCSGGTHKFLWTALTTSVDEDMAVDADHFLFQDGSGDVQRVPFQ